MKDVKGTASKLYKEFEDGDLKPLKPKYKKPLPVQLDDDEIVKIAEAAGKLQVEIEGLEDALAKEKAKRKTVIDEKKDKLKSYLHQQDSRTREEEVQCVDLPDYARNLVEIVRVDDGTIVDTRAMVANERQQDLGVKDPKKN